jgi:hypothetical protein
MVFLFRLLYSAFHALIMGGSFTLISAGTIVSYYLLLGVNLQIQEDFAGIYVGDIYLKFEDKLSIYIDEVNIEIEESNETTPIPELKPIFEYVAMAQEYVGEIVIEKLEFEEIKAKVEYKNGDISLDSKPYKLSVKTAIKEEGFFIEIENIEVAQFDVKGFGKAYFQFETNTTFVDVEAVVKQIYLDVNAKLQNFENLSVLVSSGEIYDINPIFDLIGIKVEALKNLGFESLKIEEAKTNFSFSEPIKVLDNLKVIVSGKNITYRFEPKLQKAKIENAIATLKNGNLFLETVGGSYGDLPLEQTSAKIENLFTSGTLFVDAKAKIDPNSETLQKTLKHYADLDSLPVQIAGKLNTDFKMKLPFENTELEFVVNGEILKENFKPKTDIPNLQSGNVKFLYPSMKVDLEEIELGFSEMVEGVASGNLDIPTSQLNLDLRIDKIEIDENSSLQNSLFGKVSGKYTKDITVLLSKSSWQFGEIEIEASQFFANYDINHSFALIKNLGLDVADFNFTGEVSGNFDVANMKGTSEIEIENLKYSEVNISDEKWQVHYLISDEVQVDIPNLKLNVNVGDKIIISLEDIALLTQFIPLTKKYPEVIGDLEVTVGKEIDLSSHFKVKNQHVLKNNKDFVEDLNISGNIADENMKFAINNNVYFTKNSEKMNVILHNYDLNISALSEFEDNSTQKEENSKNDENSSLPKINIFLKNNSLFLTDTPNFISLKNGFVQVGGNSIYAQTQPSRGEIQFQMLDKKFVAKGTNLDRKFIYDITNFDGISGGKYNFYVEGSSENISGILQFSSLKVKDMELVNNILAFINTVPALLTLSRPGFNQDGLQISAGYGVFEKKGDLIVLKEIKIYGETVNIDVSGKIDLNKEHLDLKIDISAIKYLDKFLGKIPIINYMVLGEKGTISTGISVKGNWNDPKIAPQLHKELISTPVVIGKRVLKLPEKILELIKDLQLEDEKGKEELQKILKKVQ